MAQDAGDGAGNGADGNGQRGAIPGVVTVKIGGHDVKGMPRDPFADQHGGQPFQHVAGENDAARFFAEHAGDIRRADIPAAVLADIDAVEFPHDVAEGNRAEQVAEARDVADDLSDAPKITWIDHACAPFTLAASGFLDLGERQAIHHVLASEPAFARHADAEPKLLQGARRCARRG